MKATVLLFGLLFVGSLRADPLKDAEGLLQAGKFPEAAAAFAALPATGGEPGEVAYLKALSLHLGGRPEEAITAAEAVPGDSPWGRKARFLKGAALTKAKRHRDAEAIYAEEAARAFSPARRDLLVRELLDFAAEAVAPVAAGELTPPKPDWKKAAGLCDKVLDMPITDELRADVLFRLAMIYHQAGDHRSAQGAFHAWLRLFDPEWTLSLAPGAKNTEAKLTGKPRAEARLRLAENLLAMGRAGDARVVAENLLALLESLPAAAPDKALRGDAAWLHVRTFAPPPPLRQQQQAMDSNESADEPDTMPAQQGVREVDPFGDSGPVQRALPQGAQGDAGPIGSRFEQFANRVPFPPTKPNPGFDLADYLARLRAFLTDYPGHSAAPLAAEAIARALEQADEDAAAITAWNDFIAARNFTFDAAAEPNRKRDAATGLTPAEALIRRQQAAAFRIGQLHLRHQRYAEAIGQWQTYITTWPNGAEWQHAQSGIVDAEFQLGLAAIEAGDEAKARTGFEAFLSRYPLDSRAPRILFIFGQMHYAAAQQMKERKAPEAETTAEFQRAIDAWARLIAKYPGTEESSLALYNTALIVTDTFGRLEEGLAAFKRVTWGAWAEPARRRVEVLNSKSLAAATERVFRLTETPVVKVSVRNIEKLKISRYPLDLEAFFRSRHRMDAIDLLDIDLIAPARTWEVPVAGYARYRSIQQEIPVEFAAGEAGACVVRVEGDDWQATTLVVRSDIEVLVESARREVLAFVSHGPERKPVAGANVLVSDGEKIIASGPTGADGVFRAKPAGFEKARSVRVLVASPQGMAGGFLALDGLALSVAPEGMSRILFARDTYQPGEQVGWHAVRREIKDGLFPVPASGDGWKWRAQLPDGRLLYEGPVTWSALGVCGGSFRLPPSSFSGDYKVRVFNDKESIQAFFTVDAEPDSSRGRLVASQPVAVAYLRGETVKGAFAVRWANGLPVAGERAVLQLPDGGSRELRTDAEGTVAFECATAALKPGIYPLTLSVPAIDTALAQEIRIAADEFAARFDQPPGLVLAGEAFDVTARAVDYRGADFATALKLTVVRREPPPSGRVLEGVPWLSSRASAPADTVVAEHDVRTAADGRALQRLTLPQPGSYVLRLSGKDRQGREIKAETALRAAGGDDDSRLRLLSDTTELIAGQVLRLRVQSAAAHPHALVTVHAQAFFSHRLVAIQAGSNTLEIPVEAAFAPNFRVTVAALEGRQLHLASRPFEVRVGLKVALTAGEGGGGVTVRTTDLLGKPVPATVFARIWNPVAGEPFKPVGRVVVPKRATGLSVESSVAFAHPGRSRKLVGEAFAVADNDQVLLKNIQQQEADCNPTNTALLSSNAGFVQSNWFLAADGAAKRGVFIINPGLRLMKQDALGIDVRIGTEGITDVAWNTDHIASEAADPVAKSAESGVVGNRVAVDPCVAIETDASGEKHLPVPAPGAGAMAIVAWAMDGNSPVAVDSLVLPASRKLLVRAMLPEAVTAGQPFDLPVMVTNRGGEPVGGLSVECAVGTVAVKRDCGALDPGASRVVWLTGLTAPPQPGTVAVAVAAGGAGWRGDLTIRTLAVPVAVSTGGLFAQGEHVLALPVAKDAVGIRLVRAADLAALPGASLDAAGELCDASEPQTAASSLQHVLAALAAAKDEAAKATLQARLAVLTAELTATESPSGGWAWENIEIPPGLLTTAFTWRVLQEAKASGVLVSEMMLKRTAAFVAGRYGGIGATDFERKAVVLQSMAAAGNADFSLLNPLYRTRETLTPVALIRLCAAFIHAGREEEARELLTLIWKTGTAGKTAAGEETLYWPGSKGVAGLNAPEEATSAALWCAAKLNPAAPEARRVALWLLNSPSCAPGGTTRCRGQVMQALAAYAGVLPRAGAGDSVEILAAGQPVTAGPGDLLPVPANGKLTVRVKGAASAVVIASVIRAMPPDDPKTWEYPKIASRSYLHEACRLDDIRLTARSTSPVTQAVPGQLVRVVIKVANHPDETWQEHGNFLQIDEEIPAGCQFVEGSLQCNADGVERTGNRLRLRFGPGIIGHISYEVIALTPGTWTAAGTVLADPYDPARCRRGTANSLTILPPGRASADPYVMNRDEHLEAARILFARNQGTECLAHLDALANAKLTQDEERDTARMRLWILAERDDGDAKATIGAFELLTERHPRLVIPFGKLLRVGAAYRRLNEFERAATVFRAALDGAFLADSSLGGALEDAGDYAGGVDLQQRLWREYPDSRDVIGSLSGLAQSLSAKAPEADRLPVRRGREKLGKQALLTRSRELFERFITLYPTDDQADDATFSMVNVDFALKDYPGMVRAATAAAARHAASPFADSFKYLAALGYFWQGAFDQALAAAAPVANGEGKDRDYARYVTAQIHHAQGQPAEAIAWYEKVKSVYPDAAQAIALYEEKRVSLPEVTIFKPGEDVKVTLDYRNITEGAVQLYKVDLLKLYLREKSLSNITRIDLAGIVPQAGETFALGDGKDYAVKHRVLQLPLKEEGAYLAIVRGDHLFTSGLVLISPLRLEVKEDPPEGSVRVTVSDAATGKALADAEVKALGSARPLVVSGTTDPRGVVEVADIEGTATVIVKQGENRYAFHRGTTLLGVSQRISGAGGAGVPNLRMKGKVLEKGEYLKNIEQSNKAVQEKQMNDWDAKRRSNSKGVEASDVMTK